MENRFAFYGVTSRMKERTGRFDAIFFDLDDTLFDCWGQLVHQAHREAASAMVSAGMKADPEDAYRRRLEIHEKDPGCDLDRKVAESYGSSSEMVIDAGRKAYFERDMGEIEPFPGVIEMLERLKKTRLLFLVTRGNPATQQKKVKNLGLVGLFHEIAYLDVEMGHAKRTVFFHLLKRYRLDGPRCVAVGDRVDSEIRDGNLAGMYTVLLEHGEFVRLEPVDESEEPDARIKDILEVEGMLGGTATSF